MNQLTVIEYQDQRVLTTSQIAESYDTDSRRVSENFNRNKDRYIEGKHFIALEGQEKREFLNHTQIEDGSKNASILYLWTEKGAWLHAKSLNTDKAWEAYEMLVDDYYRVKENAALDMTALSPQLQLLINMEQKQLQIEAKQQEQDQQIAVIKETFLQRDENWRNKINGMMKGAAYRLGGNYQELRRRSYQLLEERGRCDLDRRLRNLVERLELQGATKTQLKNTTRMDVIEADVKLKEIYTTIVKEISIGTLV